MSNQDQIRTHNEAIQLRDTHGNNDFQDANAVYSASSTLPRVDGGCAAWLFIFGSFLIETFLWGFPFSFGVLQDYYTNHRPISLDPSGVAAIGTTCSGIMYLAAPFLFAIYQKWPGFCRVSTYFGLPIVVLAVVLSSFATKVWHLILTQGVLYAFGGCLLYYPVYIFLDEWFVRRKGFAYGILWAGTGSGGLLGPLVMEAGLSRYGPKTFLRGWAIALLLLMSSALYFVKPRLPIYRGSDHPRRVGFRAGFGFVKTKTFWALQCGNIVQGLGYFIPSNYLPGKFPMLYTSHARTLGISPFVGSLTVSMFWLSSIPGVICLSALCDRTKVTNGIFISTFIGALSIFLLWGFSTFSASSHPTYAGTVSEIRRVSPEADLGSIFGLLSMGRGIGNVVSGPLSEALMEWKSSGLFAYGSEYGSLITFTGITAVVALFPWAMKQLHLI